VIGRRRAKGLAAAESVLSSWSTPVLEDAMRVMLSLALSLVPFAALAAGTGDSTAPTPTETTTKCTGAQVWDEVKQACVDAQSGALDDDTLFDAARELAWAGRPQDALTVLSAMREGETDRVLTYLGFAHRKSGDLEAGLAAYDRALAQNPDNLLARSYFGQALVEMNEIELASAQLAEIRARGGAGSWAETSLSEAIRTGQTYNY
jgi:tetratricopeptide (TPR) repeat protein